jgi:hypothetical protein
MEEEKHAARVSAEERAMPATPGAAEATAARQAAVARAAREAVGVSTTSMKICA